MTLDENAAKMVDDFVEWLMIEHPWNKWLQLKYLQAYWLFIRVALNITRQVIIKFFIKIIYFQGLLSIYRPRCCKIWMSSASCKFSAHHKQQNTSTVESLNDTETGVQPQQHFKQKPKGKIWQISSKSCIQTSDSWPN